MANDDDVHIHADMTDEVSGALERIEEHAEDADRAVGELGRTATQAGAQIDRGMTRAARATGRARDAAGRFVPVAHAAGEAAQTAGRKAATGSVGFDKWAASANKASRAAGGLAATMMLIKFGTLVTGGIAVIGMLSALAAGAVMATGALAPMIGTVGALIPLMGLLAAGMALIKISGDDIKALLVPLGNEFKAMRYEITQAMVPGIQQFNQEIKAGLIPTLKEGLVELGGLFGTAMAGLGGMLAEARNARMIRELFHGFGPVIIPATSALGRFLRTLVNLAVAALPMLTAMAEGLDRTSAKLEAWSQRMVDSGRAQTWMLRSWELMKSAGATLRDFLVGLYHLFRLAGIVAREEFGGGLSKSAADFRRWTESAEGSERILRYFRETTPALRETLALIRDIAVWFGHFGADSNVAPLINQIRTELAPAFGLFMDALMGAGGFGPAIIDMFTAFFTLLGNVPLHGLTLLIQAIGSLIWGLSWLVNNVPGFGLVLGTLITGLVMAGAAFKVIGMGAAAFGWISVAAAGTGELTIAQKALHGVLGLVGPALRMVGTGLLFVGRAMLGLLINPLGLALMAVVGILLLVWWKWDEVVKFVQWGLGWLGEGFAWLGRAIAAPFLELWNLVKAVFNFIAGAWNSIPPIKIPEWVPFIGGSVFELPKLPMLERGGVIEYGTALVGEAGPEALVKGGRFLGMIGLQGPEVLTGLPRGGYVVPSVSTLTSNPGLTTGLPSSVAAAVAGALPAYGALLNRESPQVTSPGVQVSVDTGADAIVEAISDLAAALTTRRDPPPPTTDSAAALLRALRGADRSAAIAARYSYSSPGRL